MPRTHPSYSSCIPEDVWSGVWTVRAGRRIKRGRRCLGFVCTLISAHTDTVRMINKLKGWGYISDWSCPFLFNSWNYLHVGQSTNNLSWEVDQNVSFVWNNPQWKFISAATSSRTQVHFCPILCKGVPAKTPLLVSYFLSKKIQFTIPFTQYLLYLTKSDQKVDPRIWWSPCTFI